MATPYAGKWVDPGNRYLWNKDPLNIFKRNKGGNDDPIGQMYAAMTRDQWDTYVSTFVPVENQLIQYATDPGTVDRAMAEASRDVNSAFDTQAGTAERRLRSFGVQLSPEEQQASNRQLGLGRALADVGAQNLAGEMTRQRQQSILGNPAPGVPTGG